MAHQDKISKLIFIFFKTKFPILVHSKTLSVQVFELYFTPVILDTDGSPKVFVLSRLIDHISIPGIGLDLAC